MNKGGLILAGSTALLALSLSLAPAIGATSQTKAKKKATPAFIIGGFTPAVADPRLAAEFAGRGLSGGNFHFTPSPTENRGRAVNVAVRARASTPAEARRTAAEEAGGPIPTLTPTAYNLGVAVGWKRFALSGDVAKVDSALMPGSREAAEVGLSYSLKRFTGRVQVGAERTNDIRQRVMPQESSYSLDVGGSYSIARNLAVTGGVRYKIQRDRLEPLAVDDRRDSQAVYIGTAFRF
jgi:hypothetical protein